MRRQPMLMACLLVSMLAAALPQAARADFELRDANGRKILLKDDGTWKYVDAEAAAKEMDPASAPATPEVQADLKLMQRLNAPGGCRFVVMLTNNLPYEIASFVPVFAAQRASGVVYASKSAGFSGIRPGNSSIRQVLIEGIDCQEVAKLQVVGGDRCEMGELNRFSEGKGRCLALVRVVESDLLKFEK